MKDTHKGVIFLFLAVIASSTMLTVDDRPWEMAFINKQPEQDNDVTLIQSQILAGLDPTENTQSTAAGPASRKIKPTCIKGVIARDKTADLFDGEPYASVKRAGNTYIEITQKNTYMIKGKFQTQSASVVTQFPDDINHELQLVKRIGGCINLSLYLAKIKY
jgi:hypothetical protein